MTIDWLFIGYVLGFVMAGWVLPAIGKRLKRQGRRPLGGPRWPSSARTAPRRTEGDNVTNENLFPKRLKTLREKRGMSQRTLAQLCGLSRSMVGQYERGEKDPSLRTLAQIADYFGVSTDYLLGRKNF